MTRKDYIVIAATLREARRGIDHPVGYERQGHHGPHCDDILDRLEAAWIELLARDNPAFSPQKFKEASRP